MAKIELDKYYTPVELAKQLIDITYSIIGKDNIKQVIEPSAGNGSFSLQIPNCIAYDIKPEHDSIIKQNFLELKCNNDGEQTLIIGNPPFGNSTLFVNFIKQSIKFGKYIAFVLPISQLNHNINPNIQLIHSIDLTKDIVYSGVKLHCCFNIYVREDNSISKKQYVSGIKIRRSYEMYKKERYDLCICRRGASLGKIRNDNESEQNFLITIDHPLKEKIIECLTNYDWKTWMKNKYISTPHLEPFQIHQILIENISELRDEIKKNDTLINF